MIQFAPHITALAGAALLINATMTKTEGWLNSLLFRIVPATMGAVSVWMSALLFVAAGAA